ncbi:MAG: DUF1127 domain-containing protein [Tabrizicola sp.]|nr:DUF1127 domain-containing protein [Tabrizicola sp.]
MPQSHVQTLPLHRPRGLFARIRAEVSAVLARRRDRRRLGHLDAHLLRDIGLDPQEARRECGKPFWQP